MYLYIDNSQETKIVFKALVKNENSVSGEYQNPKKRSLLYFIDKFLDKLKIKTGDLSGLVILVGQGRFTATRILTTTANTLALIFKIPIIAVKEFNEAEIFKKIKKARKGIYVSATYSAEPHIDGVQKTK